MAKPKVFISGPMSGIKDFNYPAFDAVALRIEKDGGKPLNPAEIGRKYGFEREYGFYLGEAIKMLYNADIVLFIKGWESSPGSQIEHSAAQILKKNIVYDIEE